MPIASTRPCSKPATTSIYAALRDVFDLPLRHLSADDRDHLWGLAVAQYEAFLARAALPRAAEQSAMAQGR